jgi:preprotein translocase subunit SecA
LLLDATEAESKDIAYIHHPSITNLITTAQTQVEGKNFDARKNLLDYDNVLSKQRETIYGRRDKILYADDIDDIILDFFNTAGNYIATKAVAHNDNSALKTIAGKDLKRVLEPKFLPMNTLNVAAFDETPLDEVGSDIAELLLTHYKKKRQEYDNEFANRVERYIALTTVDQNWTKHIDTMARLREGIHLRSYANTNPLQDYVNEGYTLFKDTLDQIAFDAVFKLLNVRAEKKVVTPDPNAIEVTPTDIKEDSEEKLVE